MTACLPTCDDIRSAAARLKGLATVTPLIEHPVLDARTGGRILLKAESLQRVGAFKFRGAYNKIAQLDANAFPGGVVACSSGNHAQGVAEAARICGLKAAIVMPSDAPGSKIARTRAFGGEVVLYDRDTEDRDAIAKALCEERKAAFVHPFDDPDVIAGQGTVGLEMAGQAAVRGVDLDAVLAPCSGGGLTGGIATALEEMSPATEVWAVEPEGFDDMGRSLAQGVRVSNARLSGSLCDALMAPSPGSIPFEIAQRRVTGALSVSDAEVADAVRFAFAELKLVLEPGGAAALAAVLAGKLAAAGRSLGVVLSGGNVDHQLFARILAGNAR